jgi:hypothetical protein|tara:strand:+ start:4292 stop:5827 length:1536 start_codon:yes stop_codon:yes gene_type:complete
MAISLSRFLQEGQREKAKKSIASALGRERDKEGKLSGLLTVLSPLAGIASKAALAGLGLTGGGLLFPLLAGAGTSLFKKWGEEGMRKHLKMGADPSKIKSTNIYGYGKEATKEAKEGMKEGIKERGWSPESLAADIGMSYISALVPKIGVDPTTKEIGVKSGDLGEKISEAWKGKDLSKLKLLEFGDKGLIPTSVSRMKQAKMRGAEEGYEEFLSKTADVRHKSLLAEMDKLYGGDKSEAFKNVSFMPEGYGVDVETIARENISKLPTAPPLSSSLSWRDADIKQYDKYGSFGEHIGKTPQQVAQELGEKFYEQYEGFGPEGTPMPRRPNVPFASEDTFDDPSSKALMDFITTTEGVAPDTTDMDIEMYKQLFDPSPVGADFTEIGGFTPSESFATDISATMPVLRDMPAQPDVLPYSPFDFPLPDRQGSSLDTSSILQSIYGKGKGFQLPQTSAEKLQQEMQLHNRLDFQQGGQVPKYKGGGTIADYFDAKGSTLGGSNKQSLAEMLERI